MTVRVELEARAQVEVAGPGDRACPGQRPSTAPHLRRAHAGTAGPRHGRRGQPESRFKFGRLGRDAAALAALRVRASMAGGWPVTVTGTDRTDTVTQTETLPGGWSSELATGFEGPVSRRALDSDSLGAQPSGFPSQLPRLATGRVAVINGHSHNKIQSFRCKALPLRPQRPPAQIVGHQRQVSAEHSMRMSLGCGASGPARGQARKL